MALRNQPYIPLYIQDYLTDEKLNECKPESQGVFIKIMCVMHKSEEYGTILLKQKHKQTKSIYKNFALQLANQLTFSIEIIESAIIDLINEGVLILNGDKLIQKRMVKDGELSNIRAEAGSKGGKIAQAKSKATTEYENEGVYEDEGVNEIIDYLNEQTKSNYKHETPKTRRLIKTRLKEGFALEDFKIVIDKKTKEWFGNPKMNNFLRPITLFGTKFESYLNQKESKSRMQKTYDDAMKKYGDQI